MITTTSRKHLVRALADRLAISITAAGLIVNDNEHNIDETINLRNCEIEIVDQRQDDRRIIAAYVMAPQDGYLETAFRLLLEESDIVEWRKLSLEDAYLYKGDLNTLKGSTVMKRGTIASVSIRDDETLNVCVEDKAGDSMGNVIYIDTFDNNLKSLSFLQEHIGRPSIFHIEESPRGARAKMANGSKILDAIEEDESICINRDLMEASW